MPLESIDLAPPDPRNGSTAQGALLRRIDLTTLRLFIAVCEEKNLTRAASRPFASRMPAGFGADIANAGSFLS
jgi:hypothetical protein